jgi:hypothetical protein
LAHTNIININHGKTFDEKQYASDQQIAEPGDPHGYSVVVTVDSVVKTARAPFATTGGDYTVTYGAGQIVFAQSQAGKDVSVSYSYANGSTFTIKPDVGYTLDIEASKAMWSNDLVMTDSVKFQVYGFASLFAPELGLPEGTKIPIQTTTYDTLGQLVAEAAAYTPNAVAAVGGTVRGIASPRHVALFRYGTIRSLESVAGVELRISLASHTAFQGDHAAATFYCTLRKV